MTKTDFTYNVKSISESCIVPTPKDQVFDYLVKPENLPKWASEFIKSVKQEGKQFKAQTPAGQMLIKFETDKQKGVIDIYAGPTEQTMTLAPLRIIPISNKDTAITFSFFQYPGVKDEEMEIFAVWMKEHIKAFEKLFS